MIYFKVKEDSRQGKAFAQYIKTLPFVEEVAPADIPNTETIRAIKDAESGKINQYYSSEELFSKLRKKANV